MWGNNEGIITHYCVLRLSTTHTRNPRPPRLSESDGGQAMNSTNSKGEEYHGKK